jgi:hypothetical protein
MLPRYLGQDVEAGNYGSTAQVNLNFKLNKIAFSLQISLTLMERKLVPYAWPDPGPRAEGIAVLAKIWREREIAKNLLGQICYLVFTLALIFSCSLTQSCVPGTIIGTENSLV